MHKDFFWKALALASTLVLGSCATAMEAPALRALESSGERMIAYSASLVFEVKDVDATRVSILEKAKAAGATVARETTDTLVLRVPADHFRPFVEDLSTLGSISQSEIRGEDITDAYADLSLQLESKLKLRDRYTAILLKADTVDEMLEVERELERINLEIQRLEGQKLASENRVAFVTVDIAIHKKVSPGPLGWIFYLGYRFIEWLFVWS